MPYRYVRDRRDPCAVCKEIAGAGTWAEVTSNEHAVAFVPSRHPTPGSTLVVPRRHVYHPVELAEPEAIALFLLLRSTLGATLRALGCPTCQISQYVGAITEEPIDHLHWRIEPRYEDRSSRWVPITDLPHVSDDVVKDYAHRIGSGIGATD